MVHSQHPPAFFLLPIAIMILPKTRPFGVYTSTLSVVLTSAICYISFFFKELILLCFVIRGKKMKTKIFYRRTHLPVPIDQNFWQNLTAAK